MKTRGDRLSFTQSRDMRGREGSNQLGSCV